MSSGRSTSSSAASRRARRSFDAVVAPAVSAELLPALRLADRLSEFPVVGGNGFELLPEYDAAIARIVAEVDGAQR